MLRLAVISLIAILAVADSVNQSAAGSCEGAGATIETSEVSGLARQAAVRPACLVTVFLSGGNARAAIYDGAGAARSNPFPSNPDGSWFFSAARGRYDVRFSGAAPPGDSVAETVHCRSADDTAAVQTILNTRRFARFAPGVCVVGPLFVRSDTVIELAPATVLQARRGYAEGESLLTIPDAANVTIRGHGGALAMNRDEYKSGEQRHALIIRGSSNVTVERLTATGAGGDGFYIGAGPIHPYSENVELRHCVADRNRRNGLSIVSGKNVLIDGGEFRETRGTLPEAGIDVEPDKPWERAEHVRIKDVRTRHNRGGGILVAPAGMGAAAGSAISLEIDGLTSENDGGNSTGGGIRLALPGAPFRLLHEIGGEIRVSNALIVDPGAWGVAVSRWVRQAPRAVFQNVVVYNPNAEGTGATDFGWSGAENETAVNSGFVVPVIPADVNAGSQRIEFLQCRAEDRRTRPTMRQEFYVHSTAPEAQPDVLISR